jgi:hypothetical protein
MRYQKYLINSKDVKNVNIFNKALYTLLNCMYILQSTLCLLTVAKWNKKFNLAENTSQFTLSISRLCHSQLQSRNSDGLRDIVLLPC